MRTLFTLVILLCLSFLVKAQYYVKGQEPAWVKWKQISNPRYRIIHPQNYDSLAAVFNYYLDKSLTLVSPSLEHTPKRFPVVIHSNSVLSNGFVSWAPKRMEIVSAYPFDSSPEPWLFHLALHETRHVVQIDKLISTGFYKYSNYLLGQQSIGGALVFLPLWFLEGDAVNAETIYSNGGRGRQAPFYRHYLTHFGSNSGSKFSYDKWLLGSYKDFIPSHYNLGYQIVGFTNHRYGETVWTNALTQVARKPYNVMPFQIAVRKGTGYSAKQIFNQAANYHDSIFRTFKDEVDIIEYKELISKPKSKDYTEYSFPFVTTDSVLIAFKKGLSQTPSIITVDLKTGKEKLLHKPGYITSRISYSEKAIYWSEYKADPRWGYLNYSNIWVYEHSLQRARRITSQSKFFNPIELNYGYIAVIEQLTTGANAISIIDRTGERLKSTKAQSTHEIKEICGGANDEIFARCASPNGMLILRYHNLENEPDTILGPVFRDISNLAHANGNLFFTMTHNYREEVFSINVQSRNILKHTTSMFGLSDLNINQSKLVASSFNVNGSVPVQFDANIGVPYEIESTIEPFFPLKGLTFQTPDYTQENPRISSHKPYSKLANLFNIHSWAPIYFNPTEIANGTVEVYPGVTLVSQNLTSTLVSSLGYSYNITHGYHAHFEWQGWYPKIMAGVDYGNTYGLVFRGPLAPDGVAYHSEPDRQAKVRIRLPFVLSSGNIISVANLGVQFVHYNTWIWNFKDKQYQKGIAGLEPYFSFYAVNQMATRDIRPRHGIQLYASRLSSPNQKDIYGETTILKGWLFLPGLVQNHSLLLTFQREFQSTEQYIRGPRYSAPRGYDPDFVESVFTSSFDYSLPVAYPDFPIGPVVYAKRIIANIFADFASQNEFVKTETGTVIDNRRYGSAGIELTADVNLLRTPYPFRIGYRGGFKLTNGVLFHNLILSFDISNIMGFNPSNHFYKIDL